MTKRGKFKLIYLVCALLMTIALFVAAAYAIDLSIHQKDSYYSATDFLSINSTNNYYASLAGATSVSVAKTHNTSTAVEITAFDLIVFTNRGAAAPTVAGGIIPDIYDVKNNEIEERCYIFKSIPIGASVNTGLITNNSFRALVVPSKVSYKSTNYNLNNIYVDSLLVLKVANNQTFYNEAFPITSNSGAYTNLYFISDFIIDESIIFTTPCYIDLFYAIISLKEDFYIRHSYPGIFEINTIEGSFIEDVTILGKKVFIEAPYSYYKTSMVYGGGIIECLVDLDVDSSLLSAALEAICEDALYFALERLDDYIFENVVLPTKYQNYDAVITYSSANKNVFSTSGTVFRAASTTSVKVSASVTAKHKNYEKSADSVGKTINIVGTSEDAISKAYAAVFDKEIRDTFFVDDVTVDTVTTANIYRFDRGIDVATLLFDLMNKDASSKIILEAETAGYFLFNKATHNEIKALSITAERTNELLKIVGYVTEDGTAVATSIDLDRVIKVYLEFAGFNPNLKLNFKIGSATSSLKYNIARSQSEVKTLIERYMNTPYIATVNEEPDIYYLDSNNMLVNESSSFVSFSQIFVIDEINSGILRLTREAYEQLLAEPDLIYDEEDDGFMDTYNDGVAHFDFKDGKRIFAPYAVPASEYIYVLWQKFFFADGVYTDEDEFYTAFRRIEIPELGIAGGDRHEEYLTGDYFISNFGKRTIISGDSIGRLETFDGVFMNVRFVDNLGATVKYNFIKMFTNGMQGQIVRFDCTETGSDLLTRYINGVNVTTYPNDDDLMRLKRIYFDIDIDSIPPANTAVNFEVEYFYLDRGETKITINTEIYSFVVPGIYRRTLDIDKTIYDYILYCLTNDVDNTYIVLTEIFDHTNMEEIDQYVYVDEDKDITLLLVDGARIIKELYATYYNITIAGVSIDVSGITTTGIKYLIALEKLDLEAVTISSLAGLSGASNLSLKTLFLSNCGITDAILGANLYTLKNLINVDLSLNNISSLDGILYRTVSILNLSGQKVTLSNIEGLQTLYEITELNISNNKILSFEPLRSFKSLIKVYLYDNVPTSIEASFQQYFGTKGSSNISVYVHLMVNDVNVFANSGTKLVLNKKTIDADPDLTYLVLTQWYSALVLNSITYKGIQNTGQQISVPTSVKSGVDDDIFTLNLGGPTLITPLSTTNKTVFVMNIASGVESGVINFYDTTVTRLFTVNFV